jgi:hypothetical protein
MQDTLEFPFEHLTTTNKARLLTETAEFFSRILAWLLQKTHIRNTRNEALHGLRGVNFHFHNCFPT